MCFAFLEMEAEKLSVVGTMGRPPAMVMGGYQMENNLLVFDEEKQRLSA